jgi:hippurate hydrolase
LQTIVSRNINPTDTAVVSITHVHGGHTWNAIPESVTIRGTFRCFSKEVQQVIEERIKQITEAYRSKF